MMFLSCFDHQQLSKKISANIEKIMAGKVIQAGERLNLNDVKVRLSFHAHPTRLSKQRRRCLLLSASVSRCYLWSSYFYVCVRGISIAWRGGSLGAVDLLARRCCSVRVQSVGKAHFKEVKRGMMKKNKTGIEVKMAKLKDKLDKEEGKAEAKGNKADGLLTEAVINRV